MALQIKVLQKRGSVRFAEESTRLIQEKQSCSMRKKFCPAPEIELEPDPFESKSQGEAAS
jgi:hypothetical protein